MAVRPVDADDVRAFVDALGETRARRRARPPAKYTH